MRPYNSYDYKRINKKIVEAIDSQENICGIISVVMACDRLDIELENETIKQLFNEAVLARELDNSSHELGFSTLQMVYAIAKVLDVNIIFHFDIDLFRKENGESFHSELISKIQEMGIDILQPVDYNKISEYVKKDEYPIVGFIQNGEEDLSHMSPISDIKYERIYFDVKYTESVTKDGKTKVVEKPCTASIDEFNNKWYLPIENYGNCIIIKKKKID